VDVPATRVADLGSVSPTKVKHGRVTAPLRLLQLVAFT
jgi:hypothetical protein